MLSEVGSVIALKSNIVKIAIGRVQKCTGCKHCIFGMDDKYIMATAINEKEASVGDRVLIESKEINQITDGILLYILPLILLGISLVLGTSFTMIIGIIMGIVSISSLFLYFKLNNKRYQMHITKIISDESSSESYQIMFPQGGIL